MVQRQFSRTPHFKLNHCEISFNYDKDYPDAGCSKTQDALMQQYINLRQEGGIASTYNLYGNQCSSFVVDVLKSWRCGRSGFTFHASVDSIG